MILRIRCNARSVLLAVLCASFVPASAVGQDGGFEGIEEIRVSITRRDEKLQDVAATISAFNRELVEDLNLEQMADVVALIPNVQIKDAGNGAISIRGISQSFTSQSPVAAHLNGIFQFAPVTYGDFYDIATIEVQRGPVGVVYGRNATAGAINVNWETPHEEWEIFGDATLGKFDRRQFRGVVNVPLLGAGDERLNARFVVQREVSDGKRRNLAGTRNQFGTDTWTLRGTLQAKPSEDTVARLRGYWSKNEEGGTSVGSPLDPAGTPRVSTFALQQLGDHPFDPYDGLARFQQSLLNPPAGATPFYVALVATCWPVVTPGCPDASISTQSEALQYFLLNGSAAFGLPALIRDPQYFQNVDFPRNVERVFASNAWDTRDPENEVYFVDFDLVHTLRDIAVLGDVSVSLAGGFYRQKEAFFSEVDSTILEIINNFRLDDVENWVAELRIASENDGPVNWTLGLFWFDRELERDDFTRVPFVETGNITDIEESGYAPFANVTVRPFELLGAEDVADVEVFMGIRKNRDIFSNKTDALPTPLTAGGLSQTRDVFRELTYEVGFRWFVTENQTLYLKYAKGYKAGLTEFDTSVDLSDPNAGPQQNSVKEEVVRAWELGWKSNWLDGRLQTSWSAFRYSYVDLQVPKIQGFQVLTQNAANATNWGVEFEARYRPTADWLIQFAGGYLNATFDDFCAQDDLDQRSPAATDAACLSELDANASGPLQDLSGNSLEDSPRWKMSLITSYTWDLGEFGTLRPVLSFTWTDEYFRRPFNTDRFDRVEAFTKTDLRFIWTSAEERFSIEIFGENLEDDRYFGRTIAVQFPFAAAGFGQIGARVYGVRFGYHWQD